MKKSTETPIKECPCKLGVLVDKNHYLQCSVCSQNIFKDSQNLPIICCGSYTQYLTNNDRKCNYCARRYKDYANNAR